MTRAKYTYLERNETLVRMGYSSYSVYLASALWRNIRSQVYAKVGYSCTVCKRPSNCVHHLSYSEAVLKGDDIVPLVPLCDGCHLKVEFTPLKAKRSFGASLKTYYQLLGTPNPYTLGKKRKGNAAKAKAKKGKPSGKRKPLAVCWGCGKQARKLENYCRKCQPATATYQPPNHCLTCHRIIKKHRTHCTKHKPILEET